VISGKSLSFWLLNFCSLCFFHSNIYHFFSSPNQQCCRNIEFSLSVVFIFFETKSTFIGFAQVVTFSVFLIKWMSWHRTRRIFDLRFAIYTFLFLNLRFSSFNREFQYLFRENLSTIARFLRASQLPDCWLIAGHSLLICWLMTDFWTLVALWFGLNRFQTPRLMSNRMKRRNIIQRGAFPWNRSLKSSKG